MSKFAPKSAIVFCVLAVPLLVHCGTPKRDLGNEADAGSGGALGGSESVGGASNPRAGSSNRGGSAGNAQGKGGSPTSDGGALTSDGGALTSNGGDAGAAAGDSGALATCSPPERECAGECISSTACCTAADCPTGGSCVNEACQCPSDTHQCNNACVANASADHCGTGCTPCTAPTGGSASCDGKSCGASCPSGQSACAGACIANGAACTGVCPSGSHNCSGLCGLNTALTSCGALCTSCPVPANSDASCANGSCGFTCKSGFKVCNGACIATGACCTATDCKTPTATTCVNSTTLRSYSGGTCSAGSCSYTPTDKACGTGTICTGASCVAKTANGGKCQTSGECQSANCSIYSVTGANLCCQQGASNCGTCVDEKSDNANCGSCANKCGPNRTCQTGSCKCGGPSLPAACGGCASWSFESNTTEGWVVDPDPNLASNGATSVTTTGNPVHGGAHALAVSIVGSGSVAVPLCQSGTSLGTAGYTMTASVYLAGAKLGGLSFLFAKAWGDFTGSEKEPVGFGDTMPVNQWFTVTATFSETLDASHVAFELGPSPAWSGTMYVDDIQLTAP